MVPKVISFFLIPIYTIYLKPSDYGIVEICASLFQVIYTFTRLGMPGSVSRFYFDHKDDPQELRNYVKTVYDFLVFASIVISLIIGLIFYFFADNITPGVLFAPFILIVILNSALSANSSLQLRLLQSTENSKYSALLNISNAFIGIIAAIVFVAGFKMGAKGILYSQLLTTIIFFIQAQIYLRPYLKGQFKWSMLKSSFTYGINTLPHLMFIVLTPFISKLLLVHTGTIAALGIYSLAIRFAQPLQMLYTAFNQAYTPIYFSLRKEGADSLKINYYSTLIWVGCSILFMGMFFVLPPLIPLITPERFHASASIVPVLCCTFIWQIIYYLSIVELFYTKNNRFVSLMSVSVLIANTLITLIFVKKYGPEALAWGQFIGFFCMALVANFISKKYGEVKLTKGLIWQTFFVSLICLTLDKFIIPSDMFAIRSLIFVIFTSILLYFFIWRNKGILNLILSLKLNKKSATSKSTA